jgi:predicted lactoylglutathione lyase
MDQRISLITLGVEDVGAAQRFYEALGWKLGGGVDDESDHVAFFQTPAMIVALWSREKLAADSCVDDSGGWGGVTLAYNVNSPEEVDAVLGEAGAAGATIGRAGAKTVWGGYSGVFIDPDGHPWEVAHNPSWNVHPDGRTTID